jgi:hypothetical protein
MRNPNAKQLALRDPAMLALLIGSTSLRASSDFGGEFSQAGFNGGDFGGSSDFGDDYGDESFGDEYGNDVGTDFGDDYGAEFGKRGGGPSHAALVALWNKKRAATARTSRRELMLEPNKGSSAKIERYVFTLSQPIVIGTAVALNMSSNPDTSIRPQRVTMNAPIPMFAFISELKVANVSVTVGGTNTDAFDFNAGGVGQALDMPTLSPANRATLLGNYTGLVPPGIPGGLSTFLTASFKGPASIVA